MCVTDDSFFARIVILMGLFSFTYIFFPQTKYLDSPSVFSSGETSAGKIKLNK